MALAEKTISKLCSGNEDSFRPKFVLEVLPKLMSTMVVDLNNGNVHVSINGMPSLFVLLFPFFFLYEFFFLIFFSSLSFFPLLLLTFCFLF